MERVLCTVEDRVAHVRLNRPDKRNGLDLEMFEAIVAAGRQLAGDSKVRAVVLSGEGKAFCAGLDFQAFMALGDASKRLLDRDDGVANIAQEVAWVWRALPVPVIAALHGAAFGGGLQIALGADMRFARADTQLSVMEIRYGLVPDMTGSITLVELCGLDVAKDLTFTGRIVLGEEALRLGLVTRVCEDPLAEALEAARGMAGRSPHAIRAAKRLLHEAPRLGAEAALRLETELQIGLLGSKNQLEAVRATMMKDEPVFDDP